MERINLILDIRDKSIGPKKINVRGTMTAGNLIMTIKDRYNLDGSYMLRPSGTKTILKEEATVDSAGMRDGAVLVCQPIVETTGTPNAIARGIAQPFSRPFTRVFVREARTLREFDIRWQPSVLGRRDLRDPSKNRLLAVDLEGMEPLPSVSRHHAAITEETGSLYVEAITERNPVLLNGQRIPPGSRRVLSAGDTIKLGDFVLNFYVVA